MAQNCGVHQFAGQPVSIAMHPKENKLFAVGCLSGEVWVGEFLNIGRKTAWQKSHKDSVRRLRFSASGNLLFSCSRNLGLTHWDVETGAKCRVIRKAHQKSPYCLAMINENVIGTGDDGGCVKIWDLRKAEPAAVTDFAIGDKEYVSDLCPSPDQKILLASSGAQLFTLDYRNKKLLLESEEMHAELLCITFARQKTKVVCGSADGYLEFFNSGEFGNITDRLETKHEDTVDCIASVNET